MQFNFNDYSNAVNAAQNKANGQFAKVGYFKMSNDGDEALVRMNISTVDDIDFASVHTISTGGKWIKVSCLNPIGSYADKCPLCTAAQTNNAISKASKKVYIQMLASYKDKATGTFSAPIPVIWERPAGFSRELANKLRDYGNLKDVLLKVTRNGVAGDMKTTYSLDYAVPAVFKPEMIPADFSAFDNFNIAKHSYWEKTVDEINEFLATGTFPEATSTTAFTNTVQQVQTPVQQATPVQPQTQQAAPQQKQYSNFSF